MRTTTVKYQTKPQAAVQYEIALLSGALVYNPNKSEQIEGKLEWRVYKIEGDQRLPMSNSQKGMECYCGYSDSPSTTAGVDTTDNVTFDDDGEARRIYNSNSTKQFTIIYGSVTGSVFTQLARLDVPVNVIGKDAAVVASIDFDNNNASILYNSITKSYVAGSFPVSNISVVEDGKDISHTATIYVEVHRLLAQIKGRGYDISPADGAIVPLTTVNGEGIISVTVKGVESTGYVLAKYTDSAGVEHTTKFNVSRSVGRYAVEIITTPTQISYNQTTGIASSSTITATLNVIDIYGNRTPNASFSSLGAMYWRYVGDSDWTTYAPDPNSGQSASVLEIKNLDFTKSGVEFSFVDGSGNQLDYETVPFSSVTNGGDAFLVNVASMNVALTLSEISYGTPLGDVPNVIYMTKNNVVVVTGMKYKVPGYNGTIDASHTSVEAKYNGWVFVYTFSSASGKLNTKLKKVEQNSPTSVQLPIEVNDSTDNITRTIYVSYTAIQKGPAGRSYKPNTPELYDPEKTYKWDDNQRDFIYYAFKVNKEGEPDDNGALSYFQYGVKDYGMTFSNIPPAKGGNDNWEYISEYKSIIVNCLFGTNAVLGGMVFTAQTQTSEGKNDKGEANIIIDGAKGKLIANDAIIRGEVNATGGTFDKCIIKDTCTITKINAVNGTIGGFAISDSSIYTKENAYSGGSGVNSFSESKFFLHASGYSSAFLGFSATNKWAGIGLNTLPSTSATTALARFEDTVTNTFDWTKIGVYLNVAGAKTYDDIGKGNCAIYAEQGVYTGFRIGTKLTTKSVTLTKMDNVIICYNTEDITITLPSDCEKGQVMMVRPAGTKGVTIQVTSGTILRNNDTMGNGVTSFTCGGKWMHFFIYDKYNNTWIMGYTN